MTYIDGKSLCSENVCDSSHYLKKTVWIDKLKLLLEIKDNKNKQYKNKCIRKGSGHIN